MTRKTSIYLVSCVAGLTIFAFRANGSDSDVAERARAMRVWRNADGLPSDSVTAIIQTRDGFLWVGTSSGLARFDGVKFTEVRLAMSAPNHPARITALCEDSNGHLWIGTQEGGLFELEQGSVRHFAKGQGLLDDNIISLAAGERGLVWIGSRSGLNMWSGGHFQSFTSQEGLPDNFISGVNVARSGAVWITTRIGMCRYIEGHIAPYQFQTESQGRSPEYLGAYEDRRGNLWAFGDTYLINLTEGKRFNYFRSSESASVRIWSLCEGQDGRLWIGTSGRGLFCFDDNRFQPVTLGEDRLPYDVRALCEDDEANLWLGTSGGGLVQLRPRSVHILRAGQGLTASPPTALALEAGGKIYVGLERDGLFVGESGRFERVGGAEALAVRSFISFVCVDREGTVWAGTLGNGLYGLRNGHGIHLTTANGLADDTVLAGCADAQGGIWISTGAGVVHRLTEKNLARLDNEQGLPRTPVTAMISAAGGGIWLGTQDGQIFRGGDGKFTAVVITNKNDWHSVLALHEAEAGRLWIGTAGGGLSCLAGGIGMNWKVGNGLPSDVVAGVVEDSARNLWLATDAGIYRINHEEIRKSLDDVRVPLACQLMSYAKTGPNPTTIAGGRRAVLSPNGELWFATSDGLLDVDTRQPDSDPVTFPIYLESIAFNNQPAISLLQGALWSPAARDDRALKAPVDLRSLELRFTALTFAAPEGVRFRHKIEGFDPDWVDDADARSARYDGRLPYGHYRFRLAARKSGGKWREAAETFAFVVPTPLYFQTWAICLYGVTAIALITGTVRMVSHRRLRRALARLEQQQSLERERMRIARDMHDEMGSKLTKISFLSEHAKVAAESTGPLTEKIEAIAQTSRDLLRTMDQIVWVVNPRNDTLENLTAYLSHYAVEYFQNTSTECELRLPREIPRVALSSEARHNLFLTFEEALNNALKHSAATQVKVEMALNGPQFEIKVADNGKGFEVPEMSAATTQTHSGRGGNGLKNMRQRLNAIGGECLISSKPGAGATVTMRFRLTSKHANGS